ncbi:MAG: FHA domain-containing protein, partial [Microcoleus sp.]
SSAQLAKIRVKPPDAQAIHAPQGAAQISTIPVPDQKETGTSREEEELTEADNRLYYSSEDY